MDPGTYEPPRHSVSQYTVAMVDQGKHNRQSAATHEDVQMDCTNVSLAAYTSHHDSPRAIKTHQASRARCRIGEKSKNRGLLVSNLETFPL